MRTDRDIIYAAPCCSPSTYHVPGTQMFVIRTKLRVAKAPMLKAEIAKPPQHTEYLVEGGKGRIRIDEQAVLPPGQGAKGPGTHWFQMKPNENRRLHRLSLREHRRLLLEKTGKG